MIRKKEKRNRIILIFLLVVVLCVGVTSLVYLKYKVVKVEKFEVDFEVGEVLGLTTDKDELHFGRVPRGSGAIREMNITNNMGENVKVNIFTYDDNGWLKPRKNGFILNSGNSELIKIALDVPRDAEEKSYTASLKVVMLKV